MGEVALGQQIYRESMELEIPPIDYKHGIDLGLDKAVGLYEDSQKANTLVDDAMREWEDKMAEMLYAELRDEALTKLFSTATIYIYESTDGKHDYKCAVFGAGISDYFALADEFDERAEIQLCLHYKDYDSSYDMLEGWLWEQLQSHFVPEYDIGPNNVLSYSDIVPETPPGYYVVESYQVPFAL